MLLDLRFTCHAAIEGRAACATSGRGGHGSTRVILSAGSVAQHRPSRLITFVTPSLAPSVPRFKPHRMHAMSKMQSIAVSVSRPGRQCLGLGLDFLKSLDSNTATEYRRSSVICLRVCFRSVCSSVGHVRQPSC